jgi:hypothetical protein
MGSASISWVLPPDALGLIVEAIFIDLPVRVVVEVIGDLPDDVSKLEWL